MRASGLAAGGGVQRAAGGSAGPQSGCVPVAVRTELPPVSQPDASSFVKRMTSMPSEDWNATLEPSGDHDGSPALASPWSVLHAAVGTGGGVWVRTSPSTAKNAISMLSP